MVALDRAEFFEYFNVLKEHNDQMTRVNSIALLDKMYRLGRNDDKLDPLNYVLKNLYDNNDNINELNYWAAKVLSHFYSSRKDEDFISLIPYIYSTLVEEKNVDTIRKKSFVLSCVYLSGIPYYDNVDKYIEWLDYHDPWITTNALIFYFVNMTKHRQEFLNEKHLIKILNLVDYKFHRVRFFSTMIIFNYLCLDKYDDVELLNKYYNIILNYYNKFINNLSDKDKGVLQYSALTIGWLFANDVFLSIKKPIIPYSNEHLIKIINLLKDNDPLVIDASLFAIREILTSKYADFQNLDNITQNELTRSVKELWVKNQQSGKLSFIDEVAEIVCN